MVDGVNDHLGGASIGFKETLGRGGAFMSLGVPVSHNTGKCHFSESESCSVASGLFFEFCVL